ncbi:hypothetical protein diail_1686 [Diaporthe ilicicola]|nr:hypothetical protein diail_1686 [Diaporthe ilicicola]
MTPPKKQELDRILKFCATTPSKSAPSPPLRRGEVYCLSSFARRAEQWYKEDAGRQLTQRSREASNVGQRRQPSRAAKGKSEAGDYVLPEDEVDSLLSSAAASREKQARDDKGSGPPKTANTTTTSEARLPTPTEDKQESPDDKPQQPQQQQQAGPDGLEAQGSPEAALEHFRARLGRAISAKGRELRARNDRHGIRHTCTVGSRGWDCVDEEYCGHGLVERLCVRWVPKGKAHLRAAVRSEMEGFFSCSSSSSSSSSSSNNNNNTPERLAELKRARAAALRAETMGRLAALEEAAEKRAAAAAELAMVAEAEMLESPTLGRWPKSPGFLHEDVAAQQVGVAGLAFAVDVCLGEPRILML